jgi:hypothetical protein
MILSRSLIALALSATLACEAPPQKHEMAAPAPVAKPAVRTPAAPAIPTAPVAAAQAEPAAADATPPDDSRAGRLAQIEKELNAARDAFYKAYRAASEDERLKLEQPDEAESVARAFALMEDDPQDEAGFDAAVFIVRHAPWNESETNPQLLRALEVLEQYHLKNAEMATLPSMLSRRPGPRPARLIERLSSESPHAAVRGAALYAIAERMGDDLEAAERLRATEDPEQLANQKKWLGEERFERLSKLDLSREAGARKGMLERIAREFADVGEGKDTIGARASRDLFELEHLNVGMVAPEIEGTDFDNVAFKLSDYRGKVVLLDFWGHW